MVLASPRVSQTLIRLASDFKAHTRDIFLIINLNISYFNVHVLPVTNENVTSFFQGHIHIIKRSHFLPDIKPDLQEPQVAFTRQTHITKN